VYYRHFFIKGLRKGDMDMLKKVRLLLAFISLAISLSLMSTTYSRYVADATGNVELSFAKWQILVSDVDITSTTSSTISFEPVIEENEYVAANVMAPSSKGYFDINIDPTYVDVSFRYEIYLEIENDLVLDLIMTKYAFIPEGYIEGEPLDFIELEENIITNNMLYDKENPEFQFKPFTIRVYFEWYEGANELMDDESDTNIGRLAATEEATFSISANLAFEQILNDEELEESAIDEEMIIDNEIQTMGDDNIEVETKKENDKTIEPITQENTFLTTETKKEENDITDTNFKDETSNINKK
jgi:hypothetical protein